MTRLSHVLGLGVAIGAAQLANAAVRLNDDFESYANQAAFEAAWAEINTAGNRGDWVTTQASSPTHSINIGTDGTDRAGRTFTAAGAPSATNAVMFSFDFYDSNAGASPYRQYANLQNAAAPGGTGLLSMGLNNNLTSAADGGNYYMARILGYDGGNGAGAYFKLNQGPASTLRSTGWHNLKAVITPSETKFYVDNVLASTETYTNSSNYLLVRLGGGVSSTTTAYYDNVKVINDQLAIAASAPNHNGDSSVGTVDGGFVDVSLDWANDTNNKYDLFLWKNGDAVPTTPTAAGLTSSDFFANDLLGNTLYNWKVNTYNEFDDKFTATQTWSFTTAPVPEPAGLTLLAGAGMFLRRRRNA